MTEVRIEHIGRMYFVDVKVPMLEYFVDVKVPMLEYFVDVKVPMLDSTRTAPCWKNFRVCRTYDDAVREKMRLVLGVADPTHALPALPVWRNYGSVA